MSEDQESENRNIGWLENPDVQSCFISEVEESISVQHPRT